MREEKKAAPAAVAVPHEQMTEEIDNVLSDPDTQLSPGAERALRWLRTWTDAPLVLSAAPTTQAAPQPADPQELLPEIARLQRALAFWLPMGPAEDHPLQERIAHDAFLLAGYYGPDEPSAYELGHVALAGTAAPAAQGDAEDAARERCIEIAKAAKEVECPSCGLRVISNCDSRHGCPMPDIYAAARAQAQEGGA